MGSFLENNSHCNKLENRLQNALLWLNGDDKLMARSDHSHDDDEMLTVIPNIFQVACGGNSVGNKPGCVSWQQGLFVSSD